MLITLPYADNYDERAYRQTTMVLWPWLVGWLHCCCCYVLPLASWAELLLAWRAADGCLLATSFLLAWDDETPNSSTATDTVLYSINYPIWQYIHTKEPWLYVPLSTRWAITINRIHNHAWFTAKGRMDMERKEGMKEGRMLKSNLIHLP